MFGHLVWIGATYDVLIETASMSMPAAFAISDAALDLRLCILVASAFVLSEAALE